MAVAFADLRLSVTAGNHRILPQFAGVFPEPQGAALVDLVVLAQHEVDHLVRRKLVKLMRVGSGQSGLVPGVLDHGDLHSQADAEVRHMMFPGVLRRFHHALDSPSAEPAGNDDSLQAAQPAFQVFRRQGFGIDPFDFHLCIQRVSRVPERFRYGQVGVVQLYIFPDQADPDRIVLVPDTLHHRLPFPQVRFRRVDAQFPADHGRNIRLLKHQRRGVQDRHCHVFDHPCISFTECWVGLDLCSPLAFR